MMATFFFADQRGEDNYFLPGGHVEFDEDVVTALKREIQEEIGGELENAQFVGLVENSFLQDGNRKHEINVVFAALLVSPDIKNLEDHIECVWVPLGEFKKGSVLPASLKEKVIEWMGDRQIFFGSEKDGKIFA